MNYVDILRAQLVIDEGSKDKPYVDTAGKVSIGVGRNLTDVGISQDELDLMFANDVARATATAQNLFYNFDTLTDNRKAALCNMAFNLGPSRLIKFRGLIAAVKAEDYDKAAASMLKSLWATQVGDRAQRLADLMRSG